MEQQRKPRRRAAVGPDAALTAQAAGDAHRISKHAGLATKVDESAAKKKKRAAHEPLRLHSHAERGVGSLTLTQLHGGQSSSSTARRNSRGAAPCAEFALSEQFHLLHETSAQSLRASFESFYDSDRQFATGKRAPPFLLRGCEPIQDLFELPSTKAELERVVSAIAGLPLRLHSMSLELASCAVQKEPAVGGQGHGRRAREEWREEPVPLTLLTLLTRHAATGAADDGGGTLLFRPDGDADTPLQRPIVERRLRKPGEAVLMQGSQATITNDPCCESLKQSVLLILGSQLSWAAVECGRGGGAGGEMLLVSTAFVVGSSAVPDSSALTSRCLSSSPPGVALMQFTNHWSERVGRSAAAILSLLRLPEPADSMASTAGDGGSATSGVHSLGTSPAAEVAQWLACTVSEVRGLGAHAGEIKRALGRYPGRQDAAILKRFDGLATALNAALQAPPSAVDAAVAARRSSGRGRRAAMQELWCVRLVQVHMRDACC